MIPIVILAGGKSSRMGDDKALLPFGGYESLSEYQYFRLKKEFDKVYISSKSDKFKSIPKESIIFDNSDVFAPTVAIYTALNRLDSDRVFFLSVDTPFVKIETIKELMNYELAVAKSEYIEPLCGIYSKKLLNSLKDMIKNDNHKLQLLIYMFNFKTILRDKDEFLNINYNQDYILAKSLLK